MADAKHDAAIPPAPPDAPVPPAGEPNTAAAEAEERHRRLSDANARAQERARTSDRAQGDAHAQIDRGTPTDKPVAANDFPSPK